MLRCADLMKRALTIARDPIHEAELVSGRTMSDSMGAAVYFTGVVRGSEEGNAISGIEYEAFDKMARHQFELIFDQIEQHWPIESIRVVHRIGPVATNEASLWVEVVAPHRGEAFAACQFLIEEMKRIVPIWKKPIGAA
jgi:molybdopterin synthase catalytic subunit